MRPAIGGPSWERAQVGIVRSGLFALAACLGACGGADVPVAEPAAGTVLPPFTVRGRWPDPSALRCRLLPQGGPVEARVFEDTIVRALAVWAETGRVGFELAAGEPCDIVFRWGRASDPGSPFGRDTSVAATGPLGEVCNVQFDAERGWQEAGELGTSLYQAALHEAGHALGLGHSEDPAGVMHAQRESARTVLAASDLAGLHSLYGGGVDRPGDLVLTRVGAQGGRASITLRGVAPPDEADWLLFDCDGDGDDELLVWSTAPGGLGALTIYDFEQGPRLGLTLGPILGVGGEDVRLHAHGDEQGERLLDAHWRDGTLVRRRFDATGIPHVVGAPEGELPAASARRSVGDLDGSGDPVRVRRVD